MEENTSLQAKIDLLDKQLDELKTEKVIPLQCKISWTPAIWLSSLMPLIIVVGCGLWIGFTLDKSDNMSFWIVNCITLVAIVSIVSVLTYKLVYLVSLIEQRKSDSIMSIYKEREMSVINLRKSLANKVLDSITLEDKENGNTKREKNDESESSKVKEQHDHEERMAIIKALGNNCSKESISAMLEGIKDIQKSLKDIHN